ncbi:DUF2065 domain-containing protein [Candidatus Magnetomoraceae bacterium gMMP-15]
MDFFLCVIGMVMVVEGLPYFVSPDKVKIFVQKIMEIPNNNLRILGLVLMLFGLFFVYLGKS